MRLFFLVLTMIEILGCRSLITEYANETALIHYVVTRNDSSDTWIGLHFAGTLTRVDFGFCISSRTS